MSEKITLQYPVFDGTQVYESATVVIENGVISEETVFGQGECDSSYFLMPGLIDTHTHMTSKSHLDLMVNNGVTTTCDVAATEDILEAADQLQIWSSRSMALGDVSDGRAYVESAVAQGAGYIKVVLEEPARMASKTMELEVLQDIVDCAHEHGLKVIVHAVTVSTVQMAVDAGADILLHVPMKEVFPQKLAEQIKEQGIAIAPTLVMMEAFSKAVRLGYQEGDYRNAENAVRLLHSTGVPILVGTDANESPFAPNVEHGTSQHREMELLVQAGLTPLEVLQGTTGKAAEEFKLKDIGVIAPGMRANLILVEGRPDQQITDSRKIKQIWIDGKEIL